MRVLFDQATPVPIREFLIGHTVRTAAQGYRARDTRLEREVAIKVLPASVAGDADRIMRFEPRRRRSRR